MQRWYDVGQRVEVPNGRPGPGTVPAVVTKLGRVMDEVTLDDGTSRFCYPHEIYQEED